MGRRREIPEETAAVRPMTVMDETAARLVTGAATVRTHIYRPRHGLNVRGRAQLVSFAHSCGLL